MTVKGGTRAKGYVGFSQDCPDHDRVCTGHKVAGCLPENVGAPGAVGENNFCTCSRDEGTFRLHEKHCVWVTPSIEDDHPTGS